MNTVIDKAEISAVVPKLRATGLVLSLDGDNCRMKLDNHANEEIIETFPIAEVFKLRWKIRTEKGTFLYIAKSWKGRKGRGFRLQSHKLFSDGVIWKREIRVELLNGIDNLKKRNK